MEGGQIYTTHPGFETPENENIIIWRYLDFTKYVSLLDKKALFFTRVDKLDDAFEGSFPKANIERRSSIYNDPIYKDPSKTISRFLSSSYKEARARVIVNCWHMNDYESTAMWKLYLKSDEGVAIQSTFKRLKKSFSQRGSRLLFIGKVRYIDFEKDVISQSSSTRAYMYKRKSFEHERELRVVSQYFPLGEGSSFIDINIVELKVGQYIPVDLDLLIERVYTPPISQEWFYELVKSVTKKYCLNKEIIKSSLSASPVF